MPTEILLVDDDLHIRKFISANLEARGYSVTQAIDGQYALSEFSRKYFDIIILDISMPRLDGFEVCKMIRRVSNIPIIILSARQDVLDKARCFDLGANEYITKPFGLKEFLARIDKVLRRSGIDRGKHLV